jgi:hypothetical protein
LVPVFGKGLLDLLDEVFWMLPFSGARQAKRVRQENHITEEVWNARRKAIRDEHRLPNARAELERLWKERIAKNKQLKGTEGVGAQDDSEEEDDVLPMAGARPAWRRSPAAPLIISNYI